ncbi:MAG: ABC transporter permease, partial [Endozoicomonas sp.]
MGEKIPLVNIRVFNQHRLSNAAYIAVGVLTLFLFPVLAGLVSVVLPSFHYMPTIGLSTFGVEPWKALFMTPKLHEMLLLTLSTSIFSTLTSLFLALGIVSTLWGTPLWVSLQRWLAPVMAVPHVTLAFGIAFILMPSGLLARLIAPLAGWELPPDWQTVNDAYGLSMVLLLVIKEVPFLIFMLLTAIVQIPITSTVRLGSSLGFQPMVIWLKLIWPQLYPMIRLPVYAVLAFSISVVDIALILGPSNPPTFAAQILQWIQDPDFTHHFMAASGSLLLLILVTVSIVGFYLIEILLGNITRQWLINGYRGQFSAFWMSFFRISLKFILSLFVFSVIALIIWSFVWRWRFPSLWPDWSMRSWSRAWSGLLEPIIDSLVIGAITSLLATLIAVILLELINSQRRRSQLIGRRLTFFASGIMYTPLLLPQMTFLFGVQILLLQFQLEGQLSTVIAVHLLFVLPYSFLSLSGPWFHYDHR